MPKRQALARRGVLEYARHLGKRKAAARLGTSVKNLDLWLSKGFPADKLTTAIGLSKPGGAYTIVKGSNLQKFLRRVGPRKAKSLTGIPTAELRDIAKKARRRGRIAGIKFERSKLEQLLKKKGADKAREILGISSDGPIKAARLVPKTLATKRLGRFVKAYGLYQAASYLGFTERALKGWLKTNVPRSYEGRINKAAGTTTDSGASSEAVLGAKPPENFAKQIADALKKVKNWNKRVSRRERISQKTAETWVRQGSFNENFALAQKARADAKKPIEKKPIAPPPVKPPKPPAPTLFPGEKLPQKPEPQKPEPQKPTKKEAPSEALLERMARFRQLRSESFVNGEYDKWKPSSAWDRYVRWMGEHRFGIRFYGKVQNFTHLVNLTHIGNRIIKAANHMWPMITGPGEFMTIRLTFSAPGKGNPFYDDAWIPDENTIEFFTRKTETITDVEEIEWMVRSMLSDVYEVNQEVLLFFEHFEVVKSLHKENAE